VLRVLLNWRLWEGRAGEVEGGRAPGAFWDGANGAAQAEEGRAWCLRPWIQDCGVWGIGSVARVGDQVESGGRGCMVSLSRTG
jgi:hypothetical protein